MNTKTQNKPVSSKRTMHRQKQQKNRTIRIVVMIVGMVAVIAVFVLLLSSNSSGSIGSIEGVQSYPTQERGHTDAPVEYDIIPPVGGVHNPAWMNCGVYPQPIQNENAVHSLEHGAVWISYRPDLDPLEIAKLEDLTRQSGYRLLSPYPDLPSPIVISAWGYQLQLQQVDDPRLKSFIEKYERGPESPEPGAPCTGGIGIPG